MDIQRNDTELCSKRGLDKMTIFSKLASFTFILQTLRTFDKIT